MHKKLSIAVFALGLLLLSLPPAFGAGRVDGEIARTDGTSQSRVMAAGLGDVGPDALLPVPSGAPTVHIQAGTERSAPTTVCTGDWSISGDFFTNAWGNPALLPRSMAVYQDPNTLGDCAPGSFYTHDVLAVDIELYASGAINLGQFQAEIWSVALANVAACGGTGSEITPGVLLASSPIYTVSIPAGTFGVLSLPFPNEVCVTGPYFAVVKALPAAPGGSYGTSGPIVAVVCDDPGCTTTTATLTDCTNWRFTTAGPWVANASFGGADRRIWSHGYTPNDPATRCNPGSCSWEDYYSAAANDSAGAFAFGYFLPSGSATTGRDKFGTVISAIGLDTLRACSVFVAFANAGPMSDALLEILALDGAVSGCGAHPTYPGTVLYSQVIPGASLNDFAFSYVPLTTPFVFGTLNGGPVQEVVVSLRSLQTADQMLAYTTPTDHTSCTDGHTMIRLQAGINDWKYFGEGPSVFGAPRVHHEQLIRFEMCREVLPAVETDCGPGSVDQWSSFAHDNAQTSASSLNVGDPNGVTLAWTRALPRISNFTNPTVHNDRIYMSSDQELNVYDLATGAPLGAQLAGAPQMGSSNRGNTTVAYIAALGRDVVFATGGNFNAITALETNLESSPFIWSHNTISAPPGGLGAQNRFNTSKVVNIAGTDVLFVCTEPAAGTGSIWAFDAATGALYPGWATNPVVLNAAAKHGPAVNGGKLYVGTAIGGSNVNGPLYQIDAATGVVDWNFVGVAGEGWPSGVSTEGDFVYGASKDATNTGYRYKIDVSGALPSVVWTSAQGTGLYGTPTIGRSFVYFPLDNPSFGLLQVNKDLGVVSRNFAESEICGATIFMVPQTVTLSCDAYLFAGDRNGRWWLFDATSGAAEWYRQFPVVNGGEIVSATALASHSGGTDYAVVAVRQLNGTVGQLSSYSLNSGSRPRMIQCVAEVTIEVPLNSGAGLPHSEPDVFLNVGDATLNFTATNITDPLPEGLAASIASRNTWSYRDGIRSAAADMDGYSNYSTSNLTKRQRLAGMTNEIVDGEWSASDARLIASNDELLSGSRRANSSRSMAASSALVRTSNVLINGAATPTSVAAGGDADLDWTYDGSGLGRGADDEVINLDMDDPDFNYNGGTVASVLIHYIGGCADANKRLLFNRSDSTTPGYHLENVYNTGGLSDQHADDLVWDDDPNDSETNLYDGGFFLLGDSLPGVEPDGGGEFHGEFYSHTDLFVANPAPSTTCGIDKLADVLLGAYRTGGCPGTPNDIHGEILLTGFADTNLAATTGSDRAAVGTNIFLTEVGSYDPLYGDFKLIHARIENRDAVAKDIKFGSFIDWDVTASYGDNIGVASAALNGYFIWDQSAPGNSYGIVSVRQPSLYSSVDASANLATAVRIMDNPTSIYPGPFTDDQTHTYGYINGQTGFTDEAAAPADKSGLFVESYSLAPNGSDEHAVALFGIDATSNNAAVIEAGAAALAKRAARWAGYARGDVNDDGLVDLADVCWLQGGNYIYPAAYSGDVDADGDNDAADIARLLSFVSGNAGSQPAGAWRF